MTQDELLAAFEAAWSSEGFLSCDHEQQRLTQGQDVLRRFFAQQQHAPESPTLIEEKFSVPLDDFLVTGRIDRVDIQGTEAVIIDYKSADVDDQAEANRRVKTSIQMAVYTLAWATMHGQPPKRVELRFLETGVVGQHAFSEEDLERTKDHLRNVARFIRAGDFHPTPQERACRWCAYQTICPSAFSPFPTPSS